MLLKERFVKTLYFTPKMYLKLFNFIVGGETRKGIRFMVHLWTGE